MATPEISLKSSLRKSVLKTYRARGRSVSNLWLVYSVKTNSDWILPSDRQLIHWLYFLETNPDVVSFNLAPEPILSEDNNEVRATELDAIVTFRDGSIAWHEVKAGKEPNDPSHLSQKQAQINAAAKAHRIYKRFNDTDLAPIVKISLRWLMAISYAAAIREHEHINCRTYLLIAIREQKEGTINSLLVELGGFESAVVLGVLIRLAIEGYVDINLKDKSFGKLTPWSYRE